MLKIIRNVKSNVKRARVIDLISNDVKVSTIADELGTSITAVYRLIQRMKRDGILTSDNNVTENGINHVKKWLVVSNDVKFNLKQNDIRLHNTQITVKILEKPKGYDYRKNNLISLKVRDYKITDLANNYKEEFRINDVCVKTNIDSIEIFPSDIYSETEQDASRHLMHIVFDVIRKVEALHNILLIKDRYCNIRVSRQHYALISNQLAKYYKTEQKDSVFRVFDEKDGKVRLTIDISQTPEFEAEHPTKSPTDIKICQSYFKDIINNNHYLPSDTKDMVDKLIIASTNMMSQQQQSLAIERDYAENIRKHLLVLNKIEKAFTRFNSLLSQKKITEYM